MCRWNRLFRVSVVGIPRYLGVVLGLHNLFNDSISLPRKIFSEPLGKLYHGKSSAWTRRLTVSTDLPMRSELCIRVLQFQIQQQFPQSVDLLVGWRLLIVIAGNKHPDRVWVLPSYGFGLQPLDRPVCADFYVKVTTKTP